MLFLSSVCVYVFLFFFWGGGGLHCARRLTCTRRRNNGHNTGSLNSKHKIKPSSVQQAGTFPDFHPDIKSNPYHHGKCISLQPAQSVRDYTWRFIRYIRKSLVKSD